MIAECQLLSILSAWDTNQQDNKTLLGVFWGSRWERSRSWQPITAAGSNSVCHLPETSYKSAEGDEINCLGKTFVSVSICDGKVCTLYVCVCVYMHTTPPVNLTEVTSLNLEVIRPGYDSIGFNSEQCVCVCVDTKSTWLSVHVALWISLTVMR